MKNKMRNVVWFTYIQVLTSKWFMFIAILGIAGIIFSTQYDKISSLMSGDSVTAQQEAVEEIAVSSQIPPEDAVFILQFLIVVILFLLILIYGTNIANSIVEEKSARIIETLLCYVKPLELLGGKILAYVLGIMTQVGIWAIFYLGLKIFVKMPQNLILSLFGSLKMEALLLLPISIVFGFIMYAFAFAAVASFADNAQDSTQLTMPIGIVILAVYFLSIAVMNGLSGSWIEILSYAPFFSPIMTFVVADLSIMAWPEFLLRVGVMAMETIVVAIICSKIYRRGVISYGVRKPSFLKWIGRRKRSSCCGSR